MNQPAKEGSVRQRILDLGEPRLFYAAFLLLLIGFFLYSIQSVLTPVVVFAAMLLLLSPFAGSRAHTLLVFTSGALTLLWLFAALGSLLAPFVLAFVLTYILNPGVTALQRRGVRRWLAILVFGLPAVALVVLGAVFGIPALVRQISELLDRVPEAISQFSVWLQHTRLRVLQMDLPLIDERQLATRTDGIDTAAVMAFLEERQEAIVRWLWGAVLGVRRGVSTVLTVLGYLFLTPVLVFYLLRDYETVRSRLRSLIPAARRERWTHFLGEYDQLLSRYLRGQLTAAAIVGVLTWVGLLVLGFPYSGLVGAIAGVFNIVPYLGLIASAIPALIIALLSGAIGASLIKIAIVFAIVQFLDGTVIGPRIVGGSFFGFVGLLIAVPAAVFFKLLTREFVARYQKSAAFSGAAEDATVPSLTPDA